MNDAAVIAIIGTLLGILNVWVLRYVADTKKHVDDLHAKVNACATREALQQVIKEIDDIRDVVHTIAMKVAVLEAQSRNRRIT